MGDYLSKYEIATHVREIEALVAAAAQNSNAHFVQIPLLIIKPPLLKRLFSGEKTRRYFNLKGRHIAHNAAPWTEGACIVLVSTSVAGEGYEQSLLEEVFVATPSRRKDQYRASSVEAFVRFDILNDNRLEARNARRALDRFRGALTKLTA